LPALQVLCREVQWLPAHYLQVKIASCLHCGKLTNLIAVVVTSVNLLFFISTLSLSDSIVQVRVWVLLWMRSAMAADTWRLSWGMKQVWMMLTSVVYLVFYWNHESCPVFSLS
jgi:hypothetical protein